MLWISWLVVYKSLFFTTNNNTENMYWDCKGRNSISCKNLKAVLNESNIFRYEIRTNPSFMVTPSTTVLYSSPASCRESVGHWSGVFQSRLGRAVQWTSTTIRVLWLFKLYSISQRSGWVSSTYISPNVCVSHDVSLMKKQFVITHWYTVLQDTQKKKTWLILNRPTLK